MNDYAAHEYEVPKNDPVDTVARLIAEFRSENEECAKAVDEYVQARWIELFGVPRPARMNQSEWSAQDLLVQEFQARLVARMLGA